MRFPACGGGAGFTSRPAGRWQVQAVRRSNGGGTQAYPREGFRLPHSPRKRKTRPSCAGHGGGLPPPQALRAGRTHRVRSAGGKPVFRLTDKTRPACAGRGGSVSRILSRLAAWGAIPLGWMSPSTSSNLPAGSIGPILTDCSARRLIWSCSVRGLPCPPCHQRGGGLLPHPFTLACAPFGAIGGLLSVALSVGSPRPGVTRLTALRSPDFPHVRARAAP